MLGPFSDRAHSYARKVLVNKGVRLMLGASVTEVGPHHHELHGSIAFSAWLGVHAWLLSTTRARLDDESEPIPQETKGITP